MPDGIVDLDNPETWDSAGEVTKWVISNLEITPAVYPVPVGQDVKAICAGAPTTTIAP